MSSGTGGVWGIWGTSGRRFSEVVSLYLQPGKEPEAWGMASRVKSFKMMLYLLGNGWNFRGGCPEGKVVRYHSTSPWEYPNFLFDTKILLDRQPAIRQDKE